MGEKPPHALAVAGAARRLDAGLAQGFMAWVIIAQALYSMKGDTGAE
jgi:hypothetical protein